MLTLKELVAQMDSRLKGQTIMVTADGIVLVLLNGHWHTVNDDYSVTIDLAPPSPVMPFPPAAA